MTASSFPLARFRIAIVLPLLLVPMVVRTTPPEAPPYHEYRVGGTVVSSSGGSGQNYTVALAERPTDTWERLLDGPRPLSVSALDGSFWLATRTSEPRDSIAVVVLLPGEDPIVTEVFARDSVTPAKARGYYTPIGESDGCCEDDPTLVERVEGYVYYYPDKIIMVP